MATETEYTRKIRTLEIDDQAQVCFTSSQFKLTSKECQKSINGDSSEEKVTN